MEPHDPQVPTSEDAPPPVLDDPAGEDAPAPAAPPPVLDDPANLPAVAARPLEVHELPVGTLIAVEARNVRVTMPRGTRFKRTGAGPTLAAALADAGV